LGTVCCLPLPPLAFCFVLFSLLGITVVHFPFFTTNGEEKQYLFVSWS